MTALEDLRGLITAETGCYLSSLAAAVTPHEAIVELGSFEGKSTAYLAVGAGDGVPVFAVDLWDDPRNTTGKHGFTDPVHRQRFEAQLTAVGVRDKVVAWQMDSVEAASCFDRTLLAVGAVGLLYIDADHSELAVRRDYAAWLPHLAPGATVAFDDYGTRRNPGVKTVVDSLGLDVELVAGTLAVVRVP